MKGINLLLLSGICGFLLACTEVEEVVIIVEDNSYIPCSINVNTAGLATAGADPLIDYQWYLDKAHIHEAWDTYQGLSTTKQDIQIAVVDDALQVDHEDLERNVISGASINVLVGKDDSNRTYPYPSASACAKGEGGHGTAVAGIIAARGDNGRGIKGIASQTNKIKIWGANLVSSSQLSDGIISEVFKHRVADTAVSSNSWGPFQPTHLSPLRSEFKNLINNGLNTGFGRKGISYVFAAGNEREKSKEQVLEDRASYSGILNHPGIITVCAVGFDDIFAPYSEPGPNVWICGYSATDSLSNDFTPDYANNINSGYLKVRGLATTDLSDTNGYNSEGDTILTFGVGARKCIDELKINPAAFEFNSPKLIYEGTCDRETENLVQVNGATASYTRYFTGTSAATPMVSGVIGLIRSAYPNLTWRDIKLILAESAWQPLTATALPPNLKASYALDGAPAYRNDNHNYSHSPDYGFGIVNASAAMKLADGWTSLSGPQKKKEYSGTSLPRPPIKVLADSGISFIEYVQVEVGIEENSELDFGTLTITLTSPSGAASVFALPHDCIDIKPGAARGKPSKDCNDLEDGFTFGSAVHLGESPTGDWGLSVTSDPDTNHPVNWKLILYGH